jgi:hypothetical protein
MTDPIWSGDFANNVYVSPEASRNLFLLGTDVQPSILRTNAHGLLCEEARTNLVYPSRDFSNARWVKYNASVTGGFAAPDGSNTAFRLNDNSANGLHGVYVPVSIVSGQTNIATLPIKAGTSPYGRLWFCSGASGGYADFNLSTGLSTVGGAMTRCGLIPMGDGWFNAVLVGSIALTNAYFEIDVRRPSDGASSYAGDGNGSLYIWQADLQRGHQGTGTVLADVPTTPILTTTGPVTRAADSFVRSIPTVVTMTKLIKARTAKMLPIEFQVFWHVDDGTETHDLEAYRGPNGHIIVETHEGGVSRALINCGVVGNDQDFALAVSASSAGVKASLNGGTTLTASGTPWPPGMNVERLGVNAWGTRAWNSTVAVDEPYPGLMSAAELEALSAL